MDRLFVALAGILGFLGVAAGAFGAHGLKKHFELYPDMQPIFKTAAEYQMVHTLALLGVAWAASRWPGSLVHAAGFLFIAGIVIFSGSLYVLALTRLKWLGAVTPLGGLSLMAGWLCLAAGVWKADG